MASFERKVYSVSQINAYIKRIFDANSPLRYISILGEVSNCRFPDSGHIYFTLKDKGGQLSCVMFAGRRAGLSFNLKDGASVIVSGSISVYERDGKYIMYADRIEEDGKGSLYEEFERLKKRLLEEGLFDPENKKEIPRYAGKIGVITARTAAALQDIINISGRRNPGVELILSPATVQGGEAAESVIRALKRLEKENPDVIIIARGGGSFEDLFCFNDERLVRAVYACKIPVISAVGHETDITLCDLVSDRRAPTPSAAAEIAVFELSTVIERINGYKNVLTSSIEQKINRYRDKTEFLKARLLAFSPEIILKNSRIKLTGLEENLNRYMEDVFRNTVIRLENDAALLKASSPLEKLSKGYSYITDSSGRNLRSVNDFKEGRIISATVSDGVIKARTLSVQRREDGSENKTT